MWTHCEAAEAGQRLRLVLQVGGLDGAHQLLLLGQPGVEQALGEGGHNRRGDTEIARRISRLRIEGGGIERWVRRGSWVLQGSQEETPRSRHRNPEHNTTNNTPKFSFPNKRFFCLSYFDMFLPSFCRCNVDSADAVEA